MNGELGLFDSAEDLPDGARRSKEALRIRLYLAMLVTDLAAVSAAIALASWLSVGAATAPQSLGMMLATLPLFALVAFHGRAYSIEVLVDRRLSLVRATSAATAVMLALIGAAFCLGATEAMSRATMALAFGGAFVLLCATRLAVGSLAGRLLHGSAISELMILDGPMMSGPGRPAMKVLDAAALGFCPGVADPVMLDRIGRAVRLYDRVIIACPPDRRRAWATALKGSGVNVEILAPELDDIGMLATGRHQGSSTAVIALDALGLRDRMLKRALDLAIVLPLVPILLPLFALTALAIKLDSPGPVFFVQRRVGFGNRLFMMYKFRSMRIDQLDHGGLRSASRDDDRVTRVGRLLRKASIDELPQLLNVLKGEMSIAGPRPHAVASTAEDKLFWEVDERYFNRHAVKPGLTGLAQVRGFRGATLTRLDLLNRVQADLEYLAGWSIWRDIAIILRTFRVVVHRNAF